VNGVPWTRAENAELMRLHQAGRSNNEIAAALGKTRRAVTGKLSRTNLSNPRKSPWTDERAVLLAQLWNDGLRASQIAAELGGITRNAVIGKVHRLGLSGRAKPAKARPRKPAPRPAKPRPTSPRRFPVLRPQPADAQSTLDAVALLDLHNDHCRWPLGDPRQSGFAFCGGPADLAARRPYCAHHARIAYTGRVRQEDAL
jgi:GcrA cell cycle regulator